MTGVAVRQDVRNEELRGTAGSLATRPFYDAASGAYMVKVFPGEFYITSKSDEILVTVLGSCVSACIRDPRLGIGGMNHFMLPRGHAHGWGGDVQSTRFGNFAMEKLINELIKAGCSRNSLEIKVFGGGNVTNAHNPIGTENAEFILHYLEAEGLHCAARDLGGQFPRRIHYSPTTGKVIRRLLSNSESHGVAREELEYGNRMSARPSGGEIELFDR